ncbi:MAG TPA: cytochrome c, partial [Bryobacteraceae bacterium]|nr:cytochrome c [Bryobacteraceae bacterium]
MKLKKHSQREPVFDNICFMLSALCRRPFTPALTALAALAVLALPVINHAQSADAPPKPAAVINQYCATCHSEKGKAGGLSLANLSPDQAAQHPEIWEKVVRKMRVRYMPPAGAPRPDERTYDAT